MFRFNLPYLSAIGILKMCLRCDFYCTYTENISFIAYNYLTIFLYLGGTPVLSAKKLSSTGSVSSKRKSTSTLAQEVTEVTPQV